MFNLTSPFDVSRKATKKASRVMSSLKKNLWSTLSKTPKQHLKQQKPKYQLCNNPSITITDAETGEEWEFIDHDELDGDLPNSDNTRTLREELELNAREQDDLLEICCLFDETRQCQWNRRAFNSDSIASKLAVYILHFSLQTRLSFLSSVILDITSIRTTIDNTTQQPKHQPILAFLDALHNNLLRYLQDPQTTNNSYPFSKWPEERNKPSMFSKLVQKVATMIMGPSDEEKNHEEKDRKEKDRELKEGVVVRPEDATEPWEVVPTVKDDPWSVVVKSRNVLSEFDDSGTNRQTPYERTYQYELDRRVVEADRLAMRESKKRGSK
ncbi:hypothetical protein FNAPI_13251 [Fusarium napiforme]|uniref:Uncharacterized protein n=1 Tax=Fusarium napiforme TaxID=42672 RepID=A0A8H5I6G7_9HYPO|nr:hypothetical protein FNAPI_13251 [Fusarium napiforme]